MLLIILMLFSCSKCQTTNPWDSLIPKTTEIKISEYPAGPKSCNILFWNNIGNYSILANQARNLTTISSDLINVECSIFNLILFWIILIITLVLLFAGLGIGADMTDWIHIIEFIQEIFIIVTMNIVRETCLYDFFLNYKPAFMIWFTKINIPRGTNYFQRIFFASCYFLENVTELALLSSGLFVIYLLLVVVDVFLDRKRQPGRKKTGYDKLLGLFEFGTFIRLGQILILPYTYWAFLGLRVVSFSNTTKTVDFLLSILYCLILLAFSSFAVYVINYMPINLEDKKMLGKYGAFYAHMRYQKEVKVISNEFTIRQSLKMIMAGLHVFGYFFPVGVAWTGIIIYALVMLNILVSFWYGGMYKNKFQTFKMGVFHLVVMANYIWALSQAIRTTYEIYIVSFLLQMMNVLMIFYLMFHCLAFYVVYLFKKFKGDKFSEEDQEEKTNSDNLNVGLNYSRCMQIWTYSRVMLCSINCKTTKWRMACWMA